MRLSPRAYQIECVDSIFEYFEANTGNPVCALPTGTGKSVVIAMLLERIFKIAPREKILILTHVKELVANNAAELLELWPTAPCGIYSAGLKKRDRHNSIIFAGIASVAKRAAEFGHFDLVIIDEAHMLSQDAKSMYQKFITNLKDTNPLLKVIGFTATPWRAGVGSLTQGGLFTDTCFDITDMESFNRLIDEGFLCPLIPKRTSVALDVAGVHVRGDDFVSSELQAAVDVDSVTKAALEETIELAADRHHWLVFATGVQHAMHISEMLNGYGIPTDLVHAKMPGEARDKVILDFKSGAIKALVNVGILTTGFNFPAMDLIVMLRPTRSAVLWVQMLGRLTRPFPGKENGLVLDFAGNTARLGPINDPVIPHKKEKGSGVAPVKMCQACDTWNHAKSRFCICCDAEFLFGTKLNINASVDDIIKRDLPITAILKVDRITYQLFNMAGRATSCIKISYACDKKIITELLGIESEGFHWRKAKKWWARRQPGYPMPATNAAALAVIAELRPPTHLKVIVNKKYPDILEECFDGTAFGTLPLDNVSNIEVCVAHPKKRHLAAQLSALRDYL